MNLGPLCCTVVRHLVETSNEVFDPGATFPDLETLDDLYPPSDTFCPLHADSSQLRAVYAAAEGRTFVLQGPPGTGKSQTIANLIAHCLTVGKRVLFVAQKRAALDVVHKRLAGIGLGPFCLQLHSNETTKESFRAQLREVLSVASTGSSKHWQAETNRLAEQRRVLNEYAHDLHQPCFVVNNYSRDKEFMMQSTLSLTAMAYRSLIHHFSHNGVVRIVLLVFVALLFERLNDHAE